MKRPFWKMHGAGNDFIILQETVAGAWSPTPHQIRNWCRHHTGIGADGLILLTPPTSPDCHFRMTFFNPDGREAAMCGNGARCIARFAYDQNRAPDHMRFETGSGTIAAAIQKDLVTIDLPPPAQLELHQTLEIDGNQLIVDYADTGVPHVVVTCPDITAIDVQGRGAAIRQHPQYAPKGTNVDFMQIMPDQTLRIRTYERGVEAETLACGTGVAAAALVCMQKAILPSPVHVQTAGGDTLIITMEAKQNGTRKLQLTGPAVYVFEGHMLTEMEPADTEPTTC